MPIGKPIYFEGEILKYEPNAFGFFYCKITSPKFFDHPILQRRIKTANGIKTIAGLGTWEGWIFSEEVLNATKYGYTFEIIKGYQFERGNLFKGYVEKMYSLRLQYSKDHPLNLIAKLLMNSLYGKFCMKTENTRVDIYDCSNELGLSLFQEVINSKGETITDYIQIEDHFILVRNVMADLKYDEEQDLYHGIDVNVALASAITSYGRITMCYFKNNPEFNLYYSYTDSAVIDKQLPEHLVG